MAAPLDYLVIGHVTLDLQPDGSALPGGTALYAALQAARLGLRAGIITAGNPADLDAALAPYRAEVTIDLRPRPDTTTFTNIGVGTARRQTLHRWAGPLDLADGLPPTRIVHLGPVAREVDPTTARQIRAGALVGVTPQGWLRRWDVDGRVTEERLDLRAADAGRIDALVLSETEASLATQPIEAVGDRGGVVVVTRGARGCTVLDGGQQYAAPTRPVPLIDDTGAGDVFATAFFVALAEGQEVVAAARFAHAAAGLSIGRRGVAAIASRAAIECVVAEGFPEASRQATR